MANRGNNMSNKKYFSFHKFISVTNKILILTVYKYNSTLNYSRCVCVKVAQLCPTLSDPVDWGLPGSSIRGILRARILEWIPIPFSRRTSQGIEPWSPALQADSSPFELQGSLTWSYSSLNQIIDRYSNSLSNGCIWTL